MWFIQAPSPAPVEIVGDPNILDIINALASLGMFGALLIGGFAVYFLMNKQVRNGGNTSTILTETLGEHSKLLAQAVEHSAKGVTDHAEIMATLKLLQSSLDTIRDLIAKDRST